ncbi:MAG: hypothetical protein JXQ90_18095 [Cyclobacteriaceae bacterium]
MSSNQLLKYLLVFCLTLVLLSPEVYCQQRARTSQDSKHINSLDIQFLGLGLGYKRRVSKRIFIGGQVGGGLLLGKWIVTPPFTGDEVWMGEYLRAGLYIHYILPKSWELEFGINLFKYLEDEPLSGKNTSIGLFKKIKKIYIGTRINLGENENSDFLAYSSLLVIRKKLNK